MLWEAEALARGEAPVLVAKRAVAAREALKTRLVFLSDVAKEPAARPSRGKANTVQPTGTQLQNDLLDLLLKLRKASLEVVEAIVAWRQSLAMPSQKRRLGEE